MYAHPPLSNLGSDPEGRAVVWQAILRKDPQLLAKNFRLLRILLPVLSFASCFALLHDL